MTKVFNSIKDISKSTKNTTATRQIRISFEKLNKKSYQRINESFQIDGVDFWLRFLDLENVKTCPWSSLRIVNWFVSCLMSGNCFGIRSGEYLPTLGVFNLWFVSTPKKSVERQCEGMLGSNQEASIS